MWSCGFRDGPRRAQPWSAPDPGGVVEVREGEVPVFRACGITPRAAAMRSRPSFAIGRTPGHLAITDTRDSSYLVP